MDLICSRTTFMYQSILEFEEEFKSYKTIREIKRLLEKSTSLNKFAVHILYKYKGYFENEWNQGAMYQDGVDYTKQFLDDVKNVNIKMNAIPDDVLNEKPKIVYKKGFRLVNHYANIYHLCIEFLNEITQEEAEYFKKNTMPHLLRIYSMAEKLEERRKVYEKKPNSHIAIADIMNEIGRYDYDPVGDAKKFKKDEERNRRKKR
jgi:hypothetical protein